MFSFKLSIGETAFAGRDLFTNEAIAGLFPLDARQLEVRYLQHALSVVDYDALTGHAVKGRTLNSKTMAQIPLILPPLDEQHRIADLMGTAEHARAAAATQLATIEALEGALLRRAFAEAA